MDQPQRGALWEQVGRGLAKAGCHGNSTTTTREAKGNLAQGRCSEVHSALCLLPSLAKMSLDGHLEPSCVCSSCSVSLSLTLVP